MGRWLWLGLALWGCDEGEMAEADPCASGPVLTWSNFGQGFLIENCQACHASKSDNRQGAPESVFFDTEEDAWGLADRILARGTGESPDMPPQDGIDADDRERLELWLTCGG
ncbi:MAG: hypothetical protein AAF211_02080 [Myxococcota bacterium]